MIRFRLIALIVLLVFSPLFAQEEAVTPTPQPPTKEGDLKSIVDTLNSIDEKIKQTSRELASKGALGQEVGLRDEIAVLTSQRNTLSRNLEEIITGVDATNVEVETAETNFDIQKELSALLSPVILELKKITSRPREIERLKRDLESLERKKIVSENALKRIEQEISDVRDRGLKDVLLQIKQKWQEQSQSLQAQLQVVNHKLDPKESDQVPFTTSVSQIFQLFFRSRGRNIVVALILSSLFFLAANQSHSLFLRHAGRRPKLRRFEFRLFGIGLYFFSVLGSVCIFLVTLYLFDDWVLLLLFSTLILLGLWSSRNAIAKFWNQITLLLNIGPIREGEVVVINSIPWRIERVNFYSHLVNPRLKGGKLRVTANNLLGYQSRIQAKNEVYFPTESGDWVLLGPYELYRVGPRSHGGPLTPRSVLCVLRGSIMSFASQTMEASEKSPSSLNHCLFIAVWEGRDRLSRHIPLPDEANCQAEAAGTPRAIKNCARVPMRLHWRRRMARSRRRIHPSISRKKLLHSAMR